MEVGKEVIKIFEKVLDGSREYCLYNLDEKYRIYRVDDYITIECTGKDYTISMDNRSNEEIIEQILKTIGIDVLRKEQQ